MILNFVGGKRIASYFGMDRVIDEENTMKEDEKKKKKMMKKKMRKKQKEFFKFEEKQLKDIIITFSNHIPILKNAMKNDNIMSVKDYIIREKTRKGKKNKNVLKCFICGETKGNLHLQQISSLSRCSDELIETHHLCKKCS